MPVLYSYGFAIFMVRHVASQRDPLRPIFFELIIFEARDSFGRSFRAFIFEERPHLSTRLLGVVISVGNDVLIS